MTDTITIDTADVVKHGPTGETWTVAYVQGDRLAWCGWPEGEAQLSDCKLVKAATDEDRIKLLNVLADISNQGDSRCRYARWRLGRR
jgi:hypothetical protein